MLLEQSEHWIDALECSGVLWLLWPLWSCRCWWNWLPAVTECQASNVKGRCCNMLQHLPFISHNWQLAIYMWETARMLYKRCRCSTPSWTLNLYFFFLLPSSVAIWSKFISSLGKFLSIFSINWLIISNVQRLWRQKQSRRWGKQKLGTVQWLAT